MVSCLLSEEEYISRNLELNKNLMNRNFVIYGTGQGAEKFCEVLTKRGQMEKVSYICDREDSTFYGKNFYGRTVCDLRSVCTEVDLVVVAAKKHSQEIIQRITKLMDRLGREITIIDIYEHINTPDEKLEYLRYMEERSRRKYPCFVDLNEKIYKREEQDAKVIAWYLPQFHQIAINNQFHGRGFTEWTNTSQTFPQFVGHYQPHIPYDVGYYDLLNPDALRRQAYLAQIYGVYGFSFYYYWFSGTRLMEKPLELLLENKDIDIPFCITWANETWTKCWFSTDKEIMYEQKLEENDYDHFVDDIMPYFRDERYIKINNKPLFIIYRINLFEEDVMKGLLKKLNASVTEEGFDGLYLAGMLSDTLKDERTVTDFGADAAVEFPPHRIFDDIKTGYLNKYLNPNFKGRFFDLENYVKNRKYLKSHEVQKYFRTVMIRYDNTARRGLQSAAVFSNLSPYLFKQWVYDILAESKKIHAQEENMIFVNAWNEWAEGTHLEPDLEYGYAYLQAVAEALIEVRDINE